MYFQIYPVQRKKYEKLNLVPTNKLFAFTCSFHSQCVKPAEMREFIDIMITPKKSNVAITPKKSNVDVWLQELNECTYLVLVRVRARMYEQVPL